MAKKSVLHVKNDAVFKMFFADERNKDSLISFLKSVLKLQDEDYNEILITDPHLLPEYNGDKLGIIDVKLRTKSGKIIQIEIQLKVTPEMYKRIIFYNAKLIAEQLGNGDEYKGVRKVISILITNETIIKNNTNKVSDISRYHHRFTLYDSDARIEFSDIIEIHTLELSKLPERVDGTQLYDWAKFINAETEEELNMIAERNPEVQKAVVKLVELSADEKARYIAEQREKARRDMQMWKDYMMEQGMQEGIEKGTELGIKYGTEQGMQQGIQQGIQEGIEKGTELGIKKGKEEERELWQSVIADKDAEIERLRALLESKN